MPAAWKMVQVQNCTTGQVQQDAAICSTCPAATFSLNPLNGSCDACPAGATCFGGSSFIPPSQSWHSHPYSTNIVQCPNAKACQGDRTTLLKCKEVQSLLLPKLGSPSSSLHSDCGKLCTLAAVVLTCHASLHGQSWKSTTANMGVNMHSNNTN